MYYRFFYIILSVLCFVSCEQKFTTSPDAYLTFSVDTLRFDTVFTTLQTPTLKFTVRNPQKDAINIQQISLTDGQFFYINVDGENDITKLKNIEIAGKDSIYIFVKANIDRQRDDNPVLIEDAIFFHFNSKEQHIVLQAYGQDVTILHQHWYTRDITLSGTKPYLVYDYFAIDTACTVTIPAGATFYMHDGAQMYVFGNLKVEGTAENPVRMRGDRLDDILVDVPYDYVTGRWGNIYLIQPEEAGITCQYDINHLEINSGIIGLACLNSNKENKSQLRLLNSRIHNFAYYGLYLQNTDAEIANCEISNCASYCVYLSGGNHRFVHNTIASYFAGSNIQPVSREDVAAVFVNNLSKQDAKTNIFFYNNIITGIRQENVVLATPLPDRYSATFEHNYLRMDTTQLPACLTETKSLNVFQKDADSIFVNTVFTLDRGYYDFSLDSLSPARGIADSVWAKDYSVDRLGVSRFVDGCPDAGCYEWHSAHYPVVAP